MSSSGAASRLLATHTLSSPVLHRLLRDETDVSIRSLRAASPTRQKNDRTEERKPGFPVVGDLADRQLGALADRTHAQAQGVATVGFEWAVRVMAGLNQGAAQGKRRRIAAGHRHATGSCLGLADNLGTNAPL